MALFRAVALLGFGVTVDGNHFTVQLTPANFEQEVVWENNGGKHAFVKFQAPW